MHPSMTKVKNFSNVSFLLLNSALLIIRRTYNGPYERFAAVLTMTASFMIPIQKSSNRGKGDCG